ncbi:MAG TPA: ABC transporter ATP-binding protein [Solirubrobacterales bacterium]|jgi:putative spermidine/putrescine transport system ATP-binding protein
MSSVLTPGEGHGIQVVDVTKTYGRQDEPAVKGVSLDIGPGEFMTLLGPSGSGKTTVLSLIAGFASLTSGSVKIDGTDMSRLKPHRRNLGVVFQDYALFPHMSVAKNVAFPLKQRKTPKAEIAMRVQRALELVRLEAYADRLPAQLSGGQQQRVALARAVVYEPRALLMDEPLGALDKKLRDQLQREIARMHKELGMTFVFVTHDQHEALTLADRIAVFNEGRIEQVGTPSDLYDSPATLFVAQFIGESNVFHGKVAARDRIDCAAFQLHAGSLDPRLRDAAVVIRPERLALHKDPSAVPRSHNKVGAMVADVVYAGSHHQIGLRFADGTVGTAHFQSLQELPAMPGDDVTVSWDPAHQAVVSAPKLSTQEPDPEE